MLGAGEGKPETYDIRSAVHLGQDVSRVGSGNDKVGDDGDGLDLLGPLELPVVADALGRFWRSLAGVNAAGGSREDFAQGDLYPSHILGLELVEVGSHEASE